jgi:hypothetical protein
MNTMRMLKRVCGWSSLVLVVSILLAISGAQAAAPVVGGGGGGELLGATGVNVGGPGNFDSVPNLNVGCSGVFCGTAFPFGLPDASEVSIVSAVNPVDDVDDIVISGPASRTFDSSTDTFHELTTYAIWFHGSMRHSRFSSGRRPLVRSHR